MPILIGVIVAALSLLFAFQNIEEVTLSFFGYSFTSPIALVILASLLFGFVIGMIVLVPSFFRQIAEINRLKKGNNELKTASESEGITYESEGLGEEGSIANR